MRYYGAAACAELKAGIDGERRKQGEEWGQTQGYRPGWEAVDPLAGKARTPEHASRQQQSKAAAQSTGSAVCLKGERECPGAQALLTAGGQPPAHAC